MVKFESQRISDKSGQRGSVEVFEAEFTSLAARALDDHRVHLDVTPLASHVAQSVPPHLMHSTRGMVPVPRSVGRAQWSQIIGRCVAEVVEHLENCIKAFKHEHPVADVFPVFDFAET
jgi:hypothetical protein